MNDLRLLLDRNINEQLLANNTKTRNNDTYTHKKPLNYCYLCRIDKQAFNQYALAFR